jgi:hypothetical protein
LVGWSVRERDGKRLIMKMHSPDSGLCITCAHSDDDRSPMPDLPPCRMLVALASPYVDHPDFMPEWKL